MGRLPWWLKAVFVTLGSAFMLLISGSAGSFVILVGVGGWTIWEWHKDKANIVDSLRDWVFFAALLATTLGGPIQRASNDVRDIGPSATDAISAKWNELTDAISAKWNEPRGQTPSVQFTPSALPTTTVKAP